MPFFVEFLGYATVGWSLSRKFVVMMMHISVIFDNMSYICLLFRVCCIHLTIFFNAQLLVRLFAMKVILIAKVVTISVAYGFAIILLNCNSSDDGQSESIFRSICDIPHALYLVPVAAAAAHLAFAVAKMSLEKDWVVTLAVGDKEWLSSVNSKMTQIDLAWSVTYA